MASNKDGIDRKRQSPIESSDATSNLLHNRSHRLQSSEKRLRMEEITEGDTGDKGDTAVKDEKGDTVDTCDKGATAVKDAK
eukprot:scaffold25854_cov52-Attheya_sp.AAC.1